MQHHFVQCMLVTVPSKRINLHANNGLFKSISTHKLRQSLRSTCREDSSLHVWVQNHILHPPLHARKSQISCPSFLLSSLQQPVNQYDINFEWSLKSYTYFDIHIQWSFQVSGLNFQLAFKFSDLVTSKSISVKSYSPVEKMWSQCQALVIDISANFYIVKYSRMTINCHTLLIPVILKIQDHFNCGFTSLLIGGETINIPEIFSRVHCNIYWLEICCYSGVTG